MSQSSRPVPVGILVSVSGPSRRRKMRSLADYPPIKKEVSLPLYIGVNAALALGIVLVIGVVYAVETVRAAPGQAEIGARPVQPAPQIAVPLAAAIPAEAPIAAPADAAPLADWRGWEKLLGFIPHDAPTAAAPAKSAPPSAPPPEPPPPACSNLGTEVAFFHHPPDAFRQAAKENKLVLMVHLSGNFEDQAFT